MLWYLAYELNKDVYVGICCIFDTWSSTWDIACFSSINNYTSSSCDRIILNAQVIVSIEEFLEPLRKFKIVLKLSFYKFINRNYLQQL